MSNSARHLYRKQTPRLTILKDHQERTLLSGTARNRVSGAGKHLRYRTHQEVLHAQRHWVKEEMKVIGLPYNLTLSHDLTEDDLRRVKGWLQLAVDYQPAMTVLGSLYRLGSGKGVGWLGKAAFPARTGCGSSQSGPRTHQCVQDLPLEEDLAHIGVSLAQTDLTHILSWQEKQLYPTSPHPFQFLLLGIIAQPHLVHTQTQL